ncbi:hypothetical protein GLOIN_2v1551997, partial [Rhizophagus irregularis DAOM 181602=DAOM 197198]|eukprot:XP_025183840.1 hypothetical protein GLOIN_2v1551997 [Rhizophagus irregularis DAOM 181602=DAOM 197198]
MPYFSFLLPITSHYSFLLPFIFYYFSLLHCYNNFSLPLCFTFFISFVFLFFIFI